MGLDTVELVIEVEKRFGIAIGDQEAQDTVAVGDLTRLVLSKFDPRNLHVCPTLRAFLGLRSDIRELMADMGLRVRPRQRIADVIPARKRRAFWTQLGHRIRMPPPALQRSKLMRRLLALTTLGLFVFALAPAAIDVEILPLSFFGAAFFSSTLYILTSPFCLVPPAKMATLGDAARAIAGNSLALGPSIGADPSTWVPDMLRDIIVDALGVDPKAVVPTARFVQDLGAD